LGWVLWVLLSSRLCKKGNSHNAAILSGTGSLRLAVALLRPTLKDRVPVDKFGRFAPTGPPTISSDGFATAAGRRKRDHNGGGRFWLFLKLIHGWRPSFSAGRWHCRHGTRFLGVRIPLATYPTLIIEATGSKIGHTKKGDMSLSVVHCATKSTQHLQPDRLRNASWKRRPSHSLLLKGKKEALGSGG